MKQARPVELYVYYKLAPAQAEAALAAFQAARGDASVRLLQRAEPAAAQLTWMEIYAGMDDAAALERRIAAALAPFTQGSRHCEVFGAVDG